MSISLPPGTVEFLYGTFTADQDITGSSVAYAIMADDAIPGDADWKAVDSPTRPTPNSARAAILYGPAVEGSYTVWLRLVDMPEKPVRRAGTFTVA